MNAHGMTGQRNAAKQTTLGAALPRVRCTKKELAEAQKLAHGHGLSWSEYVRFLIANDKELQKKS